MSKVNVYNATLNKLRAEALEALALIELMLENPTIVPEHSSLVEEITTQCRRLAESEGAMLTLQQYFNPTPAAPSAPAQPPPAPIPPSGPIEGEDLAARSPTMRRTAKKRTDD